MNFKKYILLGLLIILFVSAGLYNKHSHKDILVYLNDPSGQDLADIALAGSVLNQSGDTIIIRESMYGKELKITSDTGLWTRGDFIHFQGVFHKAGFIEYKKGELIWDKRIKLYLSIVGFFVFVVLLFKDWKKLRFSF